MRSLTFALVLWALSAPAFAQTAPLLHAMFQDHAVLQRDAPIRVWGEAAPHASVTVRLDRSTSTVRAGADGLWRATLPARPAGGPFTLSAQSGEIIETAADVMIGDVFLCSGQSNMQFAMRELGINANAEIAASANTNIRLLQVTRYSSVTPLTTFHDAVAWRLAAPDSVDTFSAACFYTGRDLQRAEHVPIGLIHASWGGSIIEAWISAEGFRRIGGYDGPLALLTQAATDRPGAEAGFRDLAMRWWAEHDLGQRAGWSAADFDDAAWPAMAQPGPWEESGDPALAHFDGIVWFRTSVTLTPAQAARTAQLSLGLVDDFDNTFINGQRIGGFRSKTTPRLYDVPARTLHAGPNSIAIGVLDTGTGGGLISPPDLRALRFEGGESVPLSGPWKYRISGPLDVLGRGPLAPWSGGLVANYNGMIAPIGAYSLRGVLWYQGESNIDGAPAYERLLAGLMQDWRARFENPALPFLIVQLPNFGPFASTPQRSTMAELREAQRRTVLADPHAALVVTIDIGDRYDIHPTNKPEIGRRIALAARRLIYGENVEWSGPTPLSAQRTSGGVDISFEHAEGIAAVGAASPLGFQLCDSDHRCRFADATLTSAAVHLSPSATDRFVRYCWADSPVCNLFAHELPAVPFELTLP